MRSPDNRSVARPGLLCLLMLVGALHTIAWPQECAAGSDSDRLEVERVPGGGVRATAHVLFPATTEVIQGLLTDYLRWPELFDVRMRVAGVNVREGVATVDLRIEHALLPGERRLVTESRTLPGGGLVTDLRGGDFKRYHRVWALRPSGEGTQTAADFELIFELDSLVPEWVMVLAVREELEAHFRIVKHKALEHSR